MSDTIDRQAAIDAMMRLQKEDEESYGALIPEGFDGERAVDALKQLPSAQQERKTGQLSNKEWIDFLVAQFDISRTSARDMLHVMMSVKKEDNFKKQFSQRNDCLVKDLVKDDGGRA